MKPFALILGFSLFLGVFFVYFVFDYGLGFGWTFFLLMFVLSIFLSLPQRLVNYPWKSHREGYSLMITGCCLALSFSIRDQNHLDPLNVLLTFPLIVAGGYALQNHISHIPQKLFSFFFTGLGEYFRSCMSYLLLFRNMIPSFSSTKISSDRLSRWTPQIGLSIVSGLCIIGFIIVPLLVSADPIFDKLIRDFFFFDISFDWLADISFGKIILGVIVAGLTGGAMMLMRKVSSAVLKSHNFGKIGEPYYNIIVTMITLVYLVFAIVQIKYLFLGGQLPDGLTYSQYAVKGFRQLLAILAINVMIFVVSPITLEKKSYSFLLNGILFLSTCVIWVSCLMRLQLYIDVYQLTRMRLLPWTFSILLLVLLILVYIGTQKSSISRVSVCFYGVCLWYVLLNLVGVDRIIAKYNVSHTEASKLDYAYLLHELSNDVFYVLDESHKDISMYDRNKIVDEVGNNLIEHIPKEWQEASVSYLLNK